MSHSDELLDFLVRYERAANSHDFANVEPLIAGDATYWFSDGSYVGIDEIREAFITTWSKIKKETYRISNVRWLGSSDVLASCVYTFSWEGIVDGQQKSGVGRGTNIMTKEDGVWQMLHEHLSIASHLTLRPE